MAVDIDKSGAVVDFQAAVDKNRLIFVLPLVIVHFADSDADAR